MVFVQKTGENTDPFKCQSRFFIMSGWYSCPPTQEIRWGAVITCNSVSMPDRGRVHCGRLQSQYSSSALLACLPDKISCSCSGHSALPGPTLCDRNLKLWQCESSFHTSERQDEVRRNAQLLFLPKKVPVMKIFRQTGTAAPSVHSGGGSSTVHSDYQKH